MLLHAINDYHGTLCWLPNFAYNHSARRIRKRDSADLSLKSLRAFINCSEPVRHESHQQFLDRFAKTGITAEQLAVSYAMAENTFAVTQTPIGQPPRLDIVDRDALENEQQAAPCPAERVTAQVNVSCGPPIDGVEVCVLDASQAILPERAVGELALRSNFMLSGYYKRPDLNANTWHDGWYLTGDMGYIADGEIYIVGRKKDLIINAGKNVYPQDLEAIANTVPGVYPGRVVAFGVPDEREGTELIAIVAESTAESEESRQEIAKAIRQRIAQQSTVTVSYVQITAPQWLIKTSSGKIARRANRQKWQAQYQR
jgi:acyl-CoA synthetase (AMP-forming)/AMP-acid ligase II